MTLEPSDPARPATLEPSDPTRPETLEGSLRRARDAGRKLLVPYVTGGLRPDWTDAVLAMAHAGADAIEIGIPFSDPVMDGPTIQEASARALSTGVTPAGLLSELASVDAVLAMAQAGADAIEIGIPFSDPVMDGPTIQEASARALSTGVTPAGLLSELASVDAGVPLVAMTYYNLVFRAGHLRFAADLRRGGVAAAIIPDLPLEESGGWEADAAASGIETVLLAAPVTPDERLVQIVARSRGFVYAVGLMGVTGERTAVAASAGLLARRVKAVTDLPVLIGFGISTPEHAVTACADADGVVVASALMRRYLDGASPDELGQQVAEIRRALDGLW